MADELPIVDIVDRSGGHHPRPVPAHDAELASHNEKHEEERALLNVEDKLRIADDLGANLLSRDRVCGDLGIVVVEGVE